MREEILNLVKGGNEEEFKASLREACESKSKITLQLQKLLKLHKFMKK